MANGRHCDSEIPIAAFMTGPSVLGKYIWGYRSRESEVTENDAETDVGTAIICKVYLCCESCSRGCRSRVVGVNDEHASGGRDRLRGRRVGLVPMLEII